MEENAPVPSTPAKPLVEVNVQKSLNKSSETPGYIAVILLFPCVISGAVLGITGVSKWNLPLTYNNSTWFGKCYYLLNYIIYNNILLQIITV